MQLKDFSFGRIMIHDRGRARLSEYFLKTDPPPFLDLCNIARRSQQQFLLNFTRTSDS